MTRSGLAQRRTPAAILLELAHAAAEHLCALSGHLPIVHRDPHAQTADQLCSRCWAVLDDVSDIDAWEADGPGRGDACPF